MALNFLLKRSGTANKRPDPASMALGELDLNYDSVSGGVFYKDSAGDVVKVGSAQVSATAPNATPAGSAGNSDGEFWYDTANSELKLWDGTAWISTGGGSGVAGVTGTAPVSVDNIDPANPVIGVDAASTLASGVVQLNDSTSSTSITEAATANAVKNAYDAGIQGQTDAAAAQATADAAMPKSGGTFDGNVTFASGVAGGTILAFGNLVPGSGYSDGLYGGVPLDGGTGTGAIANVSVNDGEVIAVILDDGGTGYTVGDVLTAFAPTLDPWSIEVDSVTAGSIRTVTLNSETEVNGSFTFNTSPTFPAGVDIGTAEQVTYDNAVSGLTATDVQGAIDEVAATADAAVPDASYTALGDILSGTGAGTYAALALGADTNVLTVDSTCPGGLKWAAGGGGGGTPEATPTTLGTLYGCSGVLANNASVGLNALCAPTTGCLNVAVGVDAARPLTTGRCNTAVGHQAMASVLSSRNNVALGYQALCTAQSGNSNVAVGMCSLFSSVFGYSNVAVGCCAGFALDAGAENTLIGDGAGSLITTGNRNVVIGSRVEVADGTASEQLAIGFNFNRWLTGDSNYAIKPGNGVIDCAGSCGTVGQVLMSTGSNAICWGTAGGGSGTVTSITAGAGLTGGTITTSGTIDINFTEVLSPGEFTASGQLLAGTGTGTYTALAVGSDTQVLTADSTCTGGVKWAAAGGAAPSPATPTVAGIVKGLTSDTSLVAALGTCAYSGLIASAPSNSNVAIGYWAMRSSSGTTVNSIAIGPLAMGSSVGASNNVAIGNSTLCQVQTLNNVAVGNSALRFMTTGACNVALGAGTGGDLDSGSNNTFVGFCAGQFVFSGSRNTWIGSLAGTTTMGETSNNTVLIGACSVLSAANVCNQVGIFNGSVHARFTGAASAWTFASDVRDKENVADLALGLDFVNRVQPRTFTWNMRGSDVDQGKLSAGFIAQELQSLSEEFNADYLELVDTSDVDRYTVAKSNLIPILVKAIQELSERNDLLEARMATLEGN